MYLYILDSELAAELRQAGYVLSEFKDINGVSIWECSYDGDFLDIGALEEANKIIIGYVPQTIYL